MAAGWICANLVTVIQYTIFIWKTDFSFLNKKQTYVDLMVMKYFLHHSVHGLREQFWT